MTTSKIPFNATDIFAIAYGLILFAGCLATTIVFIAIGGELVRFVPTALAVAAIGGYVLGTVARDRILITRAQIVSLVFGIILLTAGIGGVLSALVHPRDEVGVAVPAAGVAAVAIIILAIKVLDIVRAQRPKDDVQAS